MPIFDHPFAALFVLAPLTFAVATLVGSALARAGFPLQDASRRIGHIDGLRGYLALAVLIHHFVIWTNVTRLDRPWGAPVENVLNQLGPGAVALFFMTTGFVFYPRVLTGWRGNRWVAVYIGRVFRIVPLVAVSVAIIAAIVHWRTGAMPGVRDVRAAALWISSWSQPALLGDPLASRLNAHVLWSLWYEWFFYLLVLPACAFGMDIVRGRLPSWIVPAALLVVTLAARAFHLPRNVQVYVPLFAVGMLAFEVSRHERFAARLRGAGAAVLSVAVLAAAMLLFHEPFGIVPMAGFALFFTAVACGNPIGGMLATRGALVLGECSYGLYLLHGIVLALTFVEGRGAIDALPVAWLGILLPLLAIVAVLVTATTYLAIERPGIRAGKRLAGWWTGRRRPAVSAPELEVAP
ncbi:acyltransferase [Microvirga sp. SRT01]|uniref:Acyltransferase n=1 Tax=Sphingomonas longa TaxID=2778730 RepID=A0ABS2D3G0_9SPHN|nr:acyltransferase [Microvirga sp. SRT01]MBM6575428.1 acyltransferase [Sphingomonas sp. BT552]MBR7708477.1 acyltransferase [Microvirga sp. SRT01]